MRISVVNKSCQTPHAAWRDLRTRSARPSAIMYDTDSMDTMGLTPARARPAAPQPRCADRERPHTRQLLHTRQ